MCPLLSAKNFLLLKPALNQYLLQVQQHLLEMNFPFFAFPATFEIFPLLIRKVISQAVLARLAFTWHHFSHPAPLKTLLQELSSLVENGKCWMNQFSDCSLDWRLLDLKPIPIQG